MAKQKQKPKPFEVIGTPPQPDNGRSDPSDGKSAASPSGPGLTPTVNDAVTGSRHEEIATLAYELASRRNFEPGREHDDWLEAERRIEAGAPRNTPPDNPFGDIRPTSNE